MADFASVLRPFVFAGINAVQGPLYSGLQDWINKAEDYQTIDPLASSTAFALKTIGTESLVEAFAFDLNRLASAAFESLLLVTQNPVLPRSTGWTVIQSYYAAFFAAHALLRIFGVSCSHLDTGTTNRLLRLFKAYGTDQGFGIDRGVYRCVYMAATQRLECRSIASGSGSHEAIWKEFSQLVTQLSRDVLTVGVSTETQPVSYKLDELSLCLKQGNGGTAWLSEVRNKVNYQNALGCWFPYESAGRQHKKMFQTPNEWLRDPMVISTRPSGASDLVHAQHVCQFIVAFCFSIVTDLADRCPKGQSFAQVGALRLLKQASPKARKQAAEKQLDLDDV